MKVLLVLVVLLSATGLVWAQAGRPAPGNPLSAAGCPPGAACDANYPTLPLACAAADSGTLYLTRLWNNVPTVTLGCHIHALSNGIICPAGKVTLTGSFNGEPSVHFSLACGGSLEAGPGFLMLDTPAVWWGVVSSTADQTAAIQAATTGFKALNQNSVRFPTGDFYFTQVTLPEQFGILCAGVAGYNGGSRGNMSNLIAYGNSTADMIVVNKRNNWIQGCHMNGGKGPARSAVATSGTINFMARYNEFNGTFGDAAFRAGADLYAHWEDNEFSMSGYALDAQHSYDPVAYYGCSACRFTRNVVSASRGVRFSGYSVVSRDNDYELGGETAPFTALSFRDEVSSSGESQGDYFELGSGFAHRLTAIDTGIGMATVLDDKIFGHGYGVGFGTTAVFAEETTGGVYGTGFTGWDYDVRRGRGLALGTDNSWGSPTIEAVRNAGDSAPSQNMTDETWFGHVTTNGSTVTNVTVSNAGQNINFNVSGLWSGKTIAINSVPYTIASVVNYSTLTLTASAGVQSEKVLASVYDVPTQTSLYNTPGPDPNYGYVFAQGIRPSYAAITPPTTTVNTSMGQEFYCGGNNTTIAGLTQLGTGPARNWINSGFFWIYNLNGNKNCVIRNSAFHLAAGHDLTLPDTFGLEFLVFVDGTVHEVGNRSLDIPVLFSALPECSVPVAASGNARAIVTDPSTTILGTILTGTGTPATPYVQAYCDGAHWTVGGK